MKVFFQGFLSLRHLRITARIGEGDQARPSPTKPCLFFWTPSGPDFASQAPKLKRQVWTQLRSTCPGPWCSSRAWVPTDVLFQARPWHPLAFLVAFPVAWAWPVVVAAGHLGWSSWAPEVSGRSWITGPGRQLSSWDVPGPWGRARDTWSTTGGLK